MYVFCLGVDGVGGSHLTCEGKFLVVDVGCYDCCSTHGCTYYYSHTYHSATDDEDYVDVGDLGTTDGMETDTHGFDECTDTWGEQSGWNDFLPRQGDIFLHGSVALNAECLVMLAGIDALVATCGTFATVGVGVAGDYHTGFESFGYAFAYGFDGGSHFVTRNDGIECHGVASHEGVDVASAEAYVVEAQEYLAMGWCLRTFYVDDVELLVVSDLYCFHCLMNGYVIVF